MKIIKFILDNNWYSQVGGNVVWKNLDAAKVTNIYQEGISIKHRLSDSTGCITSLNMNEKPVVVAEGVARQTAEQEVGGSNPGIPPLLKHTAWLLCWHYTLAKVSHQR